MPRHVLVILDTKVQTTSSVSDLYLHINISNIKVHIKLQQKGNYKINKDHDFIHEIYVITIHFHFKTIYISVQKKDEDFLLGIFVDVL